MALKLTPNTLRGRLAPNETRQLLLDDGNYRNGFIITDFTALPTDPGSTRNIPSVNLAYNQQNLGTAVNLRRGQIAWAWFENGRPGSLIDGARIATRDIWIRNNSDETVNYLINLLPVDMTANEGVMQLIKERYQDDLDD